MKKIQLLLITCCCLLSIAAAPHTPPTPTPEPYVQSIEGDRLAEPVLPEHPTPVDLGNKVYYFNCMPCHGDVGQGLTDEFRAIWVEDHQNCWDRGCHAGRVDDEGFPIPKYVPAVAHAPDMIARYATFDGLLAYLKATHPPQRPGVLADEDYLNVTTLLWEMNGLQAPPDVTAAPLGPAPQNTAPANSPAQSSNPLLLVSALAFSVLTLSLALIRQTKHE